MEPCQVAIVSGVMTYTCGPQYMGVALATVAAYSTFTIGVTQWRIQFRRHMNTHSNTASGYLVDSLVNYETVDGHFCPPLALTGGARRSNTSLMRGWSTDGPQQLFCAIVLTQLSRSVLLY